MVKGISRQVIVVDAPEPKLFEQAIFILKDNASREGISDDALLKEAKALVDGAPSNVKEDIEKAEAEAIKSQLEEVGAVVELK